LRDEKGRLYGYSKITRDITERKNMDDQLRFLSWQIDQSHAAILTTDVNRKITSWNMGAQELYGYLKEGVLGKDANEVLRTAYSKEEVNKILVKINEQDSWTGEINRKTKTHEDIYVRSSATAVRDNKGVITGYVGVSFDISEQKRLQARVNHLANIVEQSSEAIISRGIDQRLISWNRGAEVLFGYTSAEAIGKTAIELGILQITEQESTAIGNEIIEKGSWRAEMDFFNKNGSYFHGAVGANVVKNEKGVISALVFIIKDISLHKQLEKQLKKYNQQLEAKVRVRTEEIIKTERRFRALIENSHDIITLLDESFKVIYRSPSASRNTGWTDKDMVGSDGTKNIHPDDTDKIRAIVPEQPAKDIPWIQI
jgi:PAS domain S-box-containing protein